MEEFEGPKDPENPEVEVENINLYDWEEKPYGFPYKQFFTNESIKDWFQKDESKEEEE